jgi:hypothetical protein
VKYPARKGENKLPQIAIPTLKWGKRKDRSQMCRIYTSYGQVRSLELPVVPGVIADDDKGFIMSPVNQFYKNNISWQILYEKSMFSVPLKEDIDIKDEEQFIKDLYAQFFEIISNQKIKEGKKNDLINKIMWLIAMPCTVALIFGAITLLQR